MASSADMLTTSSGKQIAYDKVVSKEGRKPCVIYIPGFLSNKDGEKATFLKKYCMERDYSYIRYDPECLGESPGDFSTVDFSDWVSNAEDVLTMAGDAKNLLVGSSMGGWIAMILASRDDLKHKIAGVVLQSPAPNFIRHYYNQLMAKLPKEAVDIVESGEVFYFKRTFENESTPTMYPVRKSFSENSEKLEIDLTQPIPITCPVKLLHGCEDESVPYVQSTKIMSLLATSDVDLTLRKSVDHSFVDETSLRLIGDSIDKLMDKLDL